MINSANYWDLSGEWRLFSEELGEHKIMLPGTLDTNDIGTSDPPSLATRLTRLHTYEGEVRLVKKLLLPESHGKRLFLEAERARGLRLIINGQEIAAQVPGTLSTPYVFEITELAGKDAEIVLLSDNRYEGWSRKSIIGASAVTNETQTNWNGILGYLRIRMEEKVFVENVRAYPRGNSVTVTAAVNSGSGDELLSLKMLINSDVFAAGKPVPEPEVKKDGIGLIFTWKDIPLSGDVLRWDEGAGNLHNITVQIDNFENTGKTIRFGIRDFGISDGMRLTLNDRVFFLRGEANCCVFPREGHPPMMTAEWTGVLRTYADYGINCMRFHSWCPPEAAFEAADEMGMMMQPELSQWNCKDALEDEESYAYYKRELQSILQTYANHPSFVMLTLGNELACEENGHKNMDRLLKLAKETDNTRLYANSSNGHYGERGVDKESDFYTAAAYYKEMLRAISSPMIGHLNQEYPAAVHHYQEAAEKIHHQGKPVFGFEVGQYEILPDFSEIKQFTGVTRAVNLEIVRQKSEEAGMLQRWEDYVEATGELALICYREEVEAVLRTPGMSGLSLLGLQDFPGQGTATVGMLNSHLQPKPFAFANPERFRQFFAPVLPLLYLTKYTYVSGELLKAEVKVANYGKNAINGTAGWRLRDKDNVLQSGCFEGGGYENGGLRHVGELAFVLPDIRKALRLDVEILVGEYQNTYPVWLYPELPELTGEMRRWYGKVHIVEELTKACLEEIAEGDMVFLEPEPVKEKLPASIGGQFSTDFWSVGTFPEQEGGMGLVIDTGHPALKEFPTEFHSNWQWWLMAGGRPLILPAKLKPIVTVPDSYSRMKHMGLLWEVRLGKGALMTSTMGLLGKQQYPEARALLYSILNYMDSEEFHPDQEISIEEVLKEIKVME